MGGGFGPLLSHVCEVVMKFYTKHFSFEVGRSFSGAWGNLCALGRILTFYHHEKRLRFGFYRAAQ